VTERLLDARELAQVLGVSARMVLRLAEQGRIPHYRVGRLVRFDPEAVIQAIASRTGGLT